MHFALLKFIGVAIIYWRKAIGNYQGWASVLFKRTFRSLLSFAFFSKERSVLSVLLRSFQKNVPFFPFFSVLLKRTERSFLRSFCLHKSYKHCKFREKERKKNVPFFLKNVPFFFRYIYVYIYLYISIYISIYISKKERNKERYVLKFICKERYVLAFFSVLFKRTFRSLRSFPFF